MHLQKLPQNVKYNNPRKMACSLPVKLIHPSITNQRSINSWQIIPCYNDWNSVCDIWISPVLANTYSCRIVWQIHKCPNNNLIVDRHLSIPCMKVATLHSVNSLSNTNHTRRCSTDIHSVVSKKGGIYQKWYLCFSILNRILAYHIYQVQHQYHWPSNSSFSPVSGKHYSTISED